ncbi:prolyl hydroxylase family protein [Acidovorax sp. NCPPB 4044]|uniref:prolyl hydroxylase family protein n=1 Tax=Acidovorax sp. NCPPB 4044 TaxID=2940490 RepID=UPI00230380DE|nr:2OG-Fe(II) oxygenase [Acidovorax sp. NCPPB 4044]MDA8520838.1 2OG-Fe(II) oxygenase [Acidovorax sp. NCPPB 4044]
MSTQPVLHTPSALSAPGLFSPAECQALIALAEREGFEPAAVRMASGTRPLPQVRNNERAQFAAPDWVATLWERVRALPLPGLDGEAAVGLPRELRFYRYRPGQRFRMHKDGPWTEGGLTSRLTLLVYLNDDFEGGDTGFRDFRVQPRTGSALVFVHDTWHEGSAVTADTKYVLRSDILCAPGLPPGTGESLQKQ